MVHFSSLLLLLSLLFVVFVVTVLTLLTSKIELLVTGQSDSNNSGVEEYLREK